MNRIRLFTLLSSFAFFLSVPVMVIAQANTPPANGFSNLLVWWTWFSHTAFYVAGMGSLLPVLAVDVQAFRSFKSIHDAATFDWGTAAFRAAQAFFLGGLGGTAFKYIAG